MTGSDSRGQADAVRDVTAVATALVAGALLMSVGDATGPVAGLVPWQADVAVGAGACLVLLLRRRWPLGLAGVVVPLSAVSVMASGAVWGAVFSLALRRRLLVAAAAATTYVATAPLYLLLQRQPRFPLWTDLVVRGVFAAAALGWGLYARDHQALVAHLRERAARAETEQSIRVTRARRDERDRIAREMHDVLAHRLSMISLHAGALQLHPGLDDATHDSATTIRAGAHEALEELRAVIGVLRHDPSDRPERPQPGLESVGDLVVDARRCGTDVVIQDQLRTGENPGPPAVCGRVAYRVVQEALTNARKHAPGSPVHLVIDGAPGSGLRIEVTNPASVPASTSTVPGAGVGLVGLAERVELAGGRLVREAGAGRFRLEVHLPWPA